MWGEQYLWGDQYIWGDAAVSGSQYIWGDNIWTDQSTTAVSGASVDLSTRVITGEP